MGTKSSFAAKIVITVIIVPGAQGPVRTNASTKLKIRCVCDTEPAPLLSRVAPTRWTMTPIVSVLRLKESVPDRGALGRRVPRRAGRARRLVSTPFPLVHNRSGGLIAIMQTTACQLTTGVKRVRTRAMRRSREVAKSRRVRRRRVRRHRVRRRRVRRRRVRRLVNSKPPS